MILNAVAEKLKRVSKDDFKGRHFEAWLIVQAVTCYLRCPPSYRDLEEMFLERGFEVDCSTINRSVLAYAPVIEKRLRQFSQPSMVRSELTRPKSKSGTRGATFTSP
jgi:transposase, IS6 family